MNRPSLLVPFLFLLFLAGSCDTNKKAHQRIARKTVPEKITRMESPERGSQYVLGDSLRVKVTFPDTLQVDSVQVFVRGNYTGTFSGMGTYTLPTSGEAPGKAGIRTKIFLGDERTESHSNQVELLSDVVPRQYAYRVKNTYPHDVRAYTQGLIFYDGWLYEGTGNLNQSTIRKVRLNNGEVVQLRNNASDIFGEGITIFNGRIYQLTYKAQICFIYDLNTFDEIQKVNYQNREGWGLTHNGEELIMSDGTHVIYFLDPELFTVKRQIEVYDNKGLVSSLNELEYINDKIYANRYYTDEIVIIDPVSGKVEGRINLKGILPVRDRKPSTDVLNGIAWDDQDRRLFVTGKYWPKLFEIDLVPLGE
jgi:glutamine cyclotransferase